MTAAFKFLIIADESPEFSVAAHYAGLRAKQTGSSLVILRVIEPTEPAHWVSLREEMEREAREAGEALLSRHQAELWAETGVETECVLREGDLRTELRALIDQDPAIKIVVLAASPGRDGPGPLVNSLAKGASFGARPLPVVVVPGALSKTEVRALALPGEA
jgi:nucleotide-binding universal stress UspA family protein